MLIFQRTHSHHAENQSHRIFYWEDTFGGGGGILEGGDEFFLQKKTQFLNPGAISDVNKKLNAIE